MARFKVWETQAMEMDLAGMVVDGFLGWFGEGIRDNGLKGRWNGWRVIKMITCSHQSIEVDWAMKHLLLQVQQDWPHFVRVSRATKCCGRDFKGNGQQVGT